MNLEEHVKTIGTLVLFDFEVVKLLGFSERASEIYFEIYSLRDGRQTVSCAIAFTPLKGTLDTNDYNILLSIWNANIDQKYNVGKAE